ncbi:FmdE family protein [Desulfoscipio sp. XC116]|uniref:FmdE family protein n=1 Tax=Desulfoscipio sp. XC116 TaxID=3144975 RepID=UPI00325AFDB0
MDIRNIMSQIQNEHITIIQEEVAVQFDNRQQTPLGFKWRNRHYEVLKPILVGNNLRGHPNYLVLTTDGGVFNLTMVREQEGAVFCRSKWVLRYRVNEAVPSGNDAGCQPAGGSGGAVKRLKNSDKLKNNARSLFAPLALTKIVQYHGHLCPELVVGYRVGLIAQRELGLTRDKAREFFILAENMSSAIDALQYMTGCTVGNQCFYAYDLGKHVYYLGRFNKCSEEPRETLRIALVNPLVGLNHAGETPVNDIEEKIIAGQAGAAEVEEYRRAINQAVSGLLNAPEGSLFTKSKVFLRSPRAVDGCDYVRCSGCGEMVAKRKAVPVINGFLCQVCATKVI